MSTTPGERTPADTLTELMEWAAREPQYRRLAIYYNPSGDWQVDVYSLNPGSSVRGGAEGYGRGGSFAEATANAFSRYAELLEHERIRS